MNEEYKMIDKNYIKELAEILTEQGLTEISIKEGDKEVVVKKEKEVVATAPAAVVSAASTAAASSAQAPEAFVCTPVEVKKGRPITSPMVGTFYRSSSPDSKPFVELGSTIQDGDVVCIIEAMKLMNEIESDTNGKVVEICVEDGQPVEFGQVLMYVE
jgi:acetyl-CoA carboxylase biotin carboxyl carrier protein